MFKKIRNTLNTLLVKKEVKTTITETETETETEIKLNETSKANEIELSAVETNAIEVNTVALVEIVKEKEKEINRIDEEEKQDVELFVRIFKNWIGKFDSIQNLKTYSDIGDFFMRRAKAFDEDVKVKEVIGKMFQLGLNGYYGDNEKSRRSVRYESGFNSHYVDHKELEDPKVRYAIISRVLLNSLNKEIMSFYVSQYIKNFEKVEAIFENLQFNFISILQDKIDPEFKEVNLSTLYFNEKEGVFAIVGLNQMRENNYKFEYLFLGAIRIVFKMDDESFNILWKGKSRERVLKIYFELLNQNLLNDFSGSEIFLKLLNSTYLRENEGADYKVFYKNKEMTTELAKLVKMAKHVKQNESKVEDVENVLKQYRVVFNSILIIGAFDIEKSNYKLRKFVKMIEKESGISISNLSEEEKKMVDVLTMNSMKGKSKNAKRKVRKNKQVLLFNV